MKTAHGLFSIKSASDDGDKRIITGVASTITPDRMEDVMEPAGAKFTLPMPLLSQHDHQQPIGEVTTAKVQADKIVIEASIVKNSDLEYIETAWKQLKAGLVKGLSIGFRILEYSHIKDSYGLHIKEWDWYELSAVTIPANAEATIASVKAYDLDPAKRSSVLTASGIHRELQRAYALNQRLRQ